MEAYLDNSATTKCSPAVANIVQKTMLEDYGNPSSMHTKGVQAEAYLKEAREIIAQTLKVQEKEILFTSGGTESNNLAIIGTAMANRRRGMHIITTQIEHSSVQAPVAFLEEQGFEVTRLSVNEKGVISLAELEAAIREDTILVSIMMVNNEIGAVEPVEEAGKLIKKKNPNTIFHSDAIQAYGKYCIYPKRWGIDLLSVSAHKIHGPKGVGFLYIQDKTKIRPILLGGGQQKGMRSGTDNVPGVAGLGVAAAACYTDFDEKIAHLYACKEKLIAGLSTMEQVIINGQKGRESAPHIVSAAILGIRSEVLLHTLEERGIYVSSGSACSSNKPAVSQTLKGIHSKKEGLESTIRFSFSVDTKEAEIEHALQVLQEVVPMLRRYSRR